jgi:hypothetical protein
VDRTAAAALVDEATRRAGLIWVRRHDGDRPARPVWHVWVDGRAYLLGGGIEQRLPAGLDAAEMATETAAAGAAVPRAEVSVASKDKGSLLAVWVADVAVVEAGTEEWDRVVPALRAKRLNSPDGDDAPARWARECTVLRLSPTGEVLETLDGVPTH